MYQLAITFDNCYWEQNCEQDHFRNTEKEVVDSHHQKQGRIAQYSASLQSSALSHPQSSTTLPQTTLFWNSLKSSRRPSAIAKSPSPSTLCVNLSDKLGRDGNLNSNECKCRIDNNLYFYYRLKEHKVDGSPRKQLLRAWLTTLEKQETLLSENLLEN